MPVSTFVVGSDDLGARRTVEQREDQDLRVLANERGGPDGPSAGWDRGAFRILWCSELLAHRSAAPRPGRAAATSYQGRGRCRIGSDVVSIAQIDVLVDGVVGRHTLPARELNDVRAINRHWVGGQDARGSSRHDPPSFRPPSGDAPGTYPRS